MAITNRLATLIRTYLLALLVSGATIAQAQTIAPNTILGNNTSTAASASALSPLAVADMMSAVIAVTLVSTSNINLSGTQTIDGLYSGNAMSVLVAGQTTSSDNGIYITSGTGPWTRALNFPAGFVISQNCALSVYVQAGTLNTGLTYRLSNAGPVTVGTSNQNWLRIPIAGLQRASNTTMGIVKTTDTYTNSEQVATVIAPPSGAGIGGAPGDCAVFADEAGSLADYGNSTSTGPCVISDANFHPLLNGGVAPKVTGAGCSLTGATANDNSGSITATGASTCTITFGGAFTNAPFCIATGIGAAVAPVLHAAPTTTSVTFNTASAGTFEYHCL